MTLGGNVVIRNGNTLDFCWRESVKSLLPVCDKVLICDGESTDGTQEEIREWCQREPKLVLCVWPWPNPKGWADWFVEWINYARQHVPCDWQIQLDADEILSERSHAELRQFIEGGKRTAVCTRYNFWRDHRHLIPEGQCLGKYVVRVAPQNLWLASDGYHSKGEEAAGLSVKTGIEIFHYGFIRKSKEFFQKERLLQDYFFGSYDPRLVTAENWTEGKSWMDHPDVSAYARNPDEYLGYHPEVIHQWLIERGMQP